MSHSTTAIRSFFLESSGGKLEALLNAGKADASHAALVAHPHPLFGGTFHNKVVFHTMKALNSFGFPVLRFNFRGTGLSEGTHDHGRGEMADIEAGLDWLDQHFHLPLVFAGFSFGAAVGLSVACSDIRVKALVGLGVPVAPIESRNYNFDFLTTCRKPKLLLSGSVDQYGSKAQLEKLAEAAADPKQLVLIEGGDHFFEGRLGEMRETIESWIPKVLVI